MFFVQVLSLFFNVLISGQESLCKKYRYCCLNDLCVCLQIAFFVVVLAVASAQILYGGISGEGIVQGHTPFAASSYGRIQSHGAGLVGLGYSYY